MRSRCARPGQRPELRACWLGASSRHPAEQVELRGAIARDLAAGVSAAEIERRGKGRWARDSGSLGGANEGVSALGRAPLGVQFTAFADRETPSERGQAQRRQDSCRKV
jgi:hypothetical protein